MTDPVTIYEVGPRDGLQNEQGVIPVQSKLQLITALAEAGLQRIEVGSFVSPRWVPQMAETDAVLAGLPVQKGVRYAALVSNMRGWEAFEACNRLGDTEVAVFISASEGFSKANLNCSIAESIDRLSPVVEAARTEREVSIVACVTNSSW